MAVRLVIPRLYRHVFEKRQQSNGALETSSDTALQCRSQCLIEEVRILCEKY